MTDQEELQFLRSFLVNNFGVVTAAMKNYNSLLDNNILPLYFIGATTDLGQELYSCGDADFSEKLLGIYRNAEENAKKKNQKISDQQGLDGNTS